LEGRVVKVGIPAGVADGARVRLTGEGESGRHGGPPGDLYVEVRVKPHRVFGRSGDDVLYELEISPARGALGGEVVVPTLDGDERIKVPSGSQAGDIIRIKRAGLPRPGTNTVGDELVRLKVAVPKKLKKRARKLYEELLSLEGEE
jgi:molecular chaperone DnaJ